MIKHQQHKHLYSAYIVTIIGVILATLIEQNNKVNALIMVSTVIILEISLSADNVIINAKILSKMSDIWQKLFIWLGLPIAILGMRIIFPILLVSINSKISFFNTIELIMYNNEIYYDSFKTADLTALFSFGSAFLMMVSLKFFTSQGNNDVRWITIIENNKVFINICKYYKNYIVIISIIIYCTTLYLEANKRLENIVFAFLIGNICHNILEIMDSNFIKQISSKLITNSCLSFIYLEILDTSFSLDSVISAFAITNDIIIIMIGSIVGAFYVRSLTLFFVKRKTLSKFQYIEHGAHYTILLLSILMFSKIFIDIPEWIISFVSIAIIIAAILSRKNKLNV